MAGKQARILIVHVVAIDSSSVAARTRNGCLVAYPPLRMFARIG